MKIRSVIPAVALPLATPVLGWGAAGHEITATIAQIHLLPSAQKEVCNILPAQFNCRLSSIAAWADKIRGLPQFRWTSGLHYINPIGDWPPETCSFGETGWKTEQNILQGIVNVTRSVETLQGTQRDYALRFLVHFIGDIHMPLHLTGRDRGGNEDRVRFDGRITNLHSLWDGLLIAQRIRTLPNYTHPLPTHQSPSVPPEEISRNRQIESALHGAIYDPYVRWVVLEGIYGWWSDQVEQWPVCPQLARRASKARRVPLSGSLGGLFKPPPEEPNLAKPEQSLFSVVGQIQPPPFEDPTDVPVCPYHWAVPIHKYNCDFIWPANLTSPHDPDHPGRVPAKDLIELDTPEYMGRIRRDKVVERLMALGGIRLAAVLNELLGSEQDKLKHGILPSLF